MPGCLSPALGPPCHLVLGLLFVYMYMNFFFFFFALLSMWGGELLRYHEQAQRYVNGETFYKPYILSLVPNCYTSIIHAFLAVDLKQAVIYQE